MASKTPRVIFFSCKEYPNKISAQSFNFEQKRLQRHLGPYILKSFQHVGMFKTCQKVKKQVWFYPAMLLIVSFPLLQTVWNVCFISLFFARKLIKITARLQNECNVFLAKNLQLRKILEFLSIQI